MASVMPVTYSEYYRVVTNSPHEGDPSAVYEDETPVPVGGIRLTPAKIVTAVCGNSKPDAYVLFPRERGKGVPYARPPAGHNVSTQSRTSVKLRGGTN